MNTWLIDMANNHQVIVYAFIVVFACIEGPILSILFGAMIKVGTFPFWPVYIALMAGDLLGDTLWYQIGRHFATKFIKRFGKYFGLTEANINKVTRIFHKYHEKILVVSKLTSGFGLAVVVLTVAGMVKIPFARYITINFIGQFIWTGFLLAVGYFFGYLYQTFTSILGKVSIAALFIFVLLALNQYRKYFSNQINRSTV